MKIVVDLKTICLKGLLWCFSYTTTNLSIANCKLKIPEEIFLKKERKQINYVVQTISRGNKSGKSRTTKFHCVQGNVLNILFECILPHWKAKAI
jgi:hypothetical protein